MVHALQFAQKTHQLLVLKVGFEPLVLVLEHLNLAQLG